VIGQRLSHFKITAKLGEGGMGEVYRAEDTKLGREVAIKVLPEIVAGDSERLARFEREAKVLASLNHPNIAGIYEVGKDNGVHFIVMELVDGEDLADRLARAPAELEEALPIALQITTALEAAHQSGIVHRDLKPANVKVTPSGEVKVLDFGLAKAWEGAPVADGSLSKSPTLTAQMTQAGTILGTAGYLSPEQARGRPVDKRTDIFSFGCILYEMLTGLRPFAGETTADSIGATLHKDPDWGRLPYDLPPTIHLLLRRCLAKQRKQRLQDIGDARLEIEDVDRADGASTLLLASADHSAPPSQRHVPKLLLGLLAVVTTISVFIAGWSLYAPRADRTVTHLTISLPIGYEITSAPAISPDGRLVAYTARHDADQSGLFVRALDEYIPRLLVSTKQPISPFFSPDGRHLGFFDDGQLWRVDVDGGAPTAVADSPLPFGGTWGPAGNIVFTPNLNSGLYRIKASGGVLEQVTVPDAAAAGYAHVWPHYDDHGDSLIFTIWGPGEKSTARLSIESLRWKKIGVGPSHARLVGATHLLQSDQDGGLRAVLFDANDAQIASEPISVLPRPIHYTYALFRPWYDVSADGNLIYVPTSGFKHRLTWITRESGEAEGILEDEASEIALSPDGGKVLYTSRGSLWMYDLVRNTKTRIESQPMIFTPEWSPDGDRIYFSANRSGDWDLYTKAVADTSPATRLLERPHGQHVSGIGKDGTIVFWDTPPEANPRLWVIPLGEQPRLFLDSEVGASRGRFSPRGDLLAYTVASPLQSHAEVFLVSYPQRTPRVQVSSDGGQEPVWSPDGRKLFYRKGDDILSVSVTTDDGLHVGIPRLELHDLSIAKTWANYRISPDGKRFLVLQRDPNAVPRQINVILNWRRELDERMAGM